MSHRQRQLGYRFAALGLAFIALLTLYPDPDAAGQAASTPMECLICGDLGGVDVLLNILLFIPFGLGLSLAGFSWRRAILLTALVSFGIELLQMKVIPGRDASLGDILTNTTGGGIGLLLGSYWRHLIFPARREARRLALAYAVILGWIWAGTAWALGPAFPLGVTWYGQWANHLEHLEPFRGTPLAISAGGQPLLPGRTIDQGRIEDLVTADPSMAFRAILGPPPPGLAPVGSIMDEWHREAILIGQDHDDLQFRIRMRATAVRLRNPIASLPSGLAGRAGDTVDASASLLDGAFELTARNGDRIASRRLALSASWGWSLLLPWNYALGNEVYFLTALWVAGLMAVLAYWSLLAGRAAIAIVPLTGVILLKVIPVLAGFPPVHWSEWVAALAGALVGALAARYASRAVDQADDPA